jgi:hypothetical protein
MIQIKRLVKNWTKNYPKIHYAISRVYESVYLFKLAIRVLAIRVIIGKRIFKNPQKLMVNIGGGGKNFTKDTGESWISKLIGIHIIAILLITTLI